MIAVDTNVLIYAHRSDSPFHSAALQCVQGLVKNRTPWALPWPVLHEFFSIVTHPRRYAPPSTAEQAMLQITDWVNVPTALLIAETPLHWATLQTLVLGGGIQGPMVHDARIAAICLQHGVREFWTADRDFSRFPKLKCRNPLIP
jgi:toxin-antitoxin system PIN domain toxin